MLHDAQTDTLAPAEEQIRHYAKSPWTDETTAYLKEQWLAGASARDIAVHLGVTRLAVIGRAHRLGAKRNVDYTFWTTTQIEQVTKLWNEGLSATLIAAQLSRKFDGKKIAKSTVLHKARRLGLSRRAPQRRDRNPMPRFRKPPVPFATIIDTDIPIEQRRTFAQLERGECKWPIGDPDKPDFFFCGARAFETGPYCTAHHHRAFGRDPGKTIPKGSYRFG